jgi:ribonuclease HI
MNYSTGIFTDGGSRGNPGRGGWGFVYVLNNKIVKEAWGGAIYTTNNQMELTAIIEALKAVGDKKIVLYSDSKLCVQTYNQWMETWCARGWKKKTGPIKNLDLVKQMYALKKACPRVKVEWIQAHSGHQWNEYADRLTQKF